ncbi:MAG TPA: hypothetical protein VFA05_08830 [Gaiellaceae bacterium]|nr:hypothetical protein [Gaiellaceae bacterium]
MAVVIARRFCGPDDSGNGGYCCGVFAGGAEAEVTLRRPPPLETPLERDDEGRVWDGETLVAEVRPATVERTAPAPVAWTDARAAEAPDPHSPFPHCFVCGRERGGDGLRIFARPVAGRDVVAASWTVAADTVGREFVWAALDCPGAYATGVPGRRGVVVLGRLAVRVQRVPQAGERCVVVGWPLGSDGRKHGAGTALFDETGELLGVGRAVWVEPRRQ